VRDDLETRVRHTRGKSTADLLRIRAGDGADAPDAVLMPSGHDEVMGVIELCSQHLVALVPFGGGTSVVGGLAPRRDGYAGVVALDLARLNTLVSIDPQSQTAELEAGVLGPAAEAMVAEHGFTIGHFPQSFEYATIGGFAATRSSGQASSGYGRFDTLIVGVKVATPLGTLVLGRAPASAAGPDLRDVVLGSEGALGVITSVTLRVRPRPLTSVYDAWGFPSFTEGAAGLRSVAQSGSTPTVLRLSDEMETMLGLATPREVGATAATGCLMVIGYEGTAESVEATRAAVGATLTEAGGVPRGAQEGISWAAGRYRGPYLRDSLLDIGVLVETIETATFWSNLANLYERVRDTLTNSLTRRGTPPIVLCHVSHVYPTGASLYFTVAARQAGDPLAQWSDAKAAASMAILEAGGTITHHHGVGGDHRPWLEAEIGRVGAEILRAIKARIDPDGILNPGILIP
jgi:alkyldihydroxyacetonephosphate synthase